jgi:acyl carrier protein
MSLDDIKAVIRTFLATNLSLPGDSIANDTKLISTRMVDSIIALRLVSHLEEKFNVEFEAHEVTQENLDTIDAIARFVESKRK